MSFTLRQVTQRAGGGDIVRTRTIAGGEASVGRGADCDIQLTDLAVSLRHARLVQTLGGGVRVEALGEQPFAVDGRFARRAEVTVSDKPSLGFGNHVLTLSPGEAPDEVVVLVERAAGAPVATGPDDEVRVFSPAEKLFGKRRMALTLLAAILVLCLAWPTAVFFGLLGPRIHPDQQWSSGALSRAHAFIGKDCKSCHQQAFVAVRDESCLACHSADRDFASRRRIATRLRAQGSPFDPPLIRAHASTGELLRTAPPPADYAGRVKAAFQRLFNHPSERCASCHLEHTPVKAEPPVSGVVDPKTWSTPALVFGDDCAACHGRLKQRLATTSLIDTPDWSRHPDFRPLVTLSPGPPHPRIERAALSQRPRENSGLVFSHQLHLSATGGVARMAIELGRSRGYGSALDCAACHRPDKSGRSFQPVEMNRDCGACHSLAFARVGGQLRMLPHGHPERVVSTLQAYFASADQGRSVAGAADRRRPGMAAAPSAAGARRGGGAALATERIRAVFAPGGTCYGCHTVLRPADPGSLSFGVAPVRLTDRYLPRGAFDHGLAQHRKDAKGRLLCSDCHAARLSDHAEDLLLPAIAKCAACHGKPKTETHPAASSNCTDCHGYHDPGAPMPIHYTARAAPPAAPSRLRKAVADLMRPGAQPARTVGD